MFTTYIIYSDSLDKFYVGSTQNLTKRVSDHNNSRSNFTKGGKPWKLVWSKEFTTRSEAIAEESRIKKKKSRKFIEWLIQIG